MSGRIGISFRAVATGAFFILLFLLQTIQLNGQDDPADSVITERLQTIRQMLEQGKVNANRWWYGWLVVYSASTVVQTSISLTSNEITTRQDMALGAATTFLGAAGQIISPLGPRYAPEKILQLPETTREEKMKKLTEMEKLLQENAAREKNGKSWKTHILYGMVNLGSGLITWIGFDRNIWAGLGNFALNTVVSEVQIFTQPSKAIKDYEDYRRNSDGLQEQSYTRSNLSWSVHVYGGGVALRMAF
jgi:hypothetical protein